MENCSRQLRCNSEETIQCSMVVSNSTGNADMWVCCVLYRDHVSQVGYHVYQLTVGTISGSQLVVKDSF